MKNLIYFTLGNNLDYIKLASLCISSLYKTGYEGDLLFITKLEDEILKEISFKTPPFFLRIEEDGLIKSSANKLKIYEYSEIKNYDKILYCDLDILWLKNPNLIFNLIEEDDVFYLSNENYLMSDNWWGGNILEDSEKKFIQKNNVRGLNAGIFGFNKKTLHHLKKIDIFYETFIRFINECIEQPFINVYLFRNNLYNTQLNSLIEHNGYTVENYDGVILHFAGGPGNFSLKYEKMLNYYNKNL